MRTKWALMAATLVLSGSALAQGSNSVADYNGALGGASLGCKLSASLYGMAQRQGSEDPKYSAQYTAKCGDSQQKGLAAYHAALAAMPAHTATVKKVYAAWLTYMDGISPSSDVDQTPAKTALDQAENELYVEVSTP